jgi:hypothetical protein
MNECSSLLHAGQILAVRVLVRRLLDPVETAALGQLSKGLNRQPHLRWIQLARYGPRCGGLHEARHPTTDRTTEEALAKEHILLQQTTAVPVISALATE